MILSIVAIGMKNARAKYRKGVLNQSKAMQNKAVQEQRKAMQNTARGSSGTERARATAAG